MTLTSFSRSCMKFSLPCLTKHCSEMENNFQTGFLQKMSPTCLNVLLNLFFNFKPSILNGGHFNVFQTYFNFSKTVQDRTTKLCRYIVYVYLIIVLSAAILNGSHIGFGTLPISSNFALGRDRITKFSGYLHFQKFLLTKLAPMTLTSFSRSYMH